MQRSGRADDHPIERPDVNVLECFARRLRAEFHGAGAGLLARVEHDQIGPRVERPERPRVLQPDAAPADNENSHAVPPGL